MSNKRKVYNAVMLITLSVIITFIITSVLMYNYFEAKNNYIVLQGEGNVELTELDRTLLGLKKIIDQKFLGKVNEKELLENAVKGYVEGLKDKYSDYYTADEVNELNEAVLGNYVGIGAYLQEDKENDVIRVLSPIEGSPAEKVGIKAGDIISKVNGIQFTGAQVNEAAKTLKGEEGTKVNVEVIREGKVINFEITRKSVKIYHISTEVLENNIGYMYIQTFDEGSAQEFKDKYNALKEKNITSLIIDLRDNGGGVVSEAIEMLDDMLDADKTLLITIDKNNNEVITKTKSNKVIDVPIIVLVNQNTASASEIMAGALKDNERAKIVGTKTYGKGVIQELLYLNNGGALKLTTNEYVTPNRNKINEIGITPDYEVILTIEDNEDTQLKKAIELLK